jgi:hypothetical protein
VNVGYLAIFSFFFGYLAKKLLGKIQERRENGPTSAVVKEGLEQCASRANSRTPHLENEEGYGRTGEGNGRQSAKAKDESPTSSG